jgi:signal transduction histidine kinase
MVNNQYALYYNKTKNFNKAIIFSKKAYDLGLQIGNKYMQMEAVGLLSDSYLGLKDYKLAYEYNVKHKELQDSLANDDNLKSFAQKDAEFEYDKKIRLLEIRQKNELYWNNFILHALLTVSALLLVIAITIYVFYRARIKANKALQDKNNEIQLQKNELTIVNSKLQESNITKDKFFSIIAHDLKSPLSAFLSLTKSMAETLEDLSMRELQSFSVAMKDSAHNLYELLVNLLEWSRMQRGVTSFNPEECLLFSIVSNNIEVLSESANQKNISIINKIDENFKVTADIPMLNTILRNLISNAIKFTTHGGKVEIGIDESPKQSNSMVFCIYVKDSGIGMNSDLIGKLFKLDEKVSRQGTDGESSTGLGLLLCKEFVEKHNGKIWANSEEGKGSTFYFSLAIEKQS